MRDKPSKQWREIMRQNKTNQSDVKALENNVAKNNVRALLAIQQVEWAKKTAQERIVMACLPANKWFFENAASNMMGYMNPVDMEIYGAENNLHVFRTSLTNIPANGHLWYGEFKDLFSGDIFWKDGSKIGYRSPSAKRAIPAFNWVWEDLCSNFTIEDVIAFAKNSRNMPNGSAVYITFRCIGKRLGGGDKKLLKKMAPYTHGAKTLRDGIRGTTTFFVKANNRHRSVQVISDIVYSGGGMGSTPMIVIGYALGCKQKITPIQRNLSKETKDSKTVNYSLGFRIKTGNIRMSNRGGGFVQYRDYKKAHTTDKFKFSPEQKEMTAMLLKKGVPVREVCVKVDAPTANVRALKARICNPHSWENGKRA